MKILFPTGSFFPAQTGGPDNTVYWITKALKQKGVTVEVVSSERGLSATIPRNEWLKKDYADVIYTTNLIHYFPFRLILAALSELKKVDVLHLSMIFYPASFLIAIVNALFYKKPVVWSIHGDLDPPMLNRSKWKKRPIQLLIKYWLKNKVIFHSTCDAETQYVKDTFGQNIQVVQLTNYMELPTPIKVKKENFFLYLGRIDPKKAIENLIEALHQSDLFIPSDFQLKIAGNHHNAYGKQLVELVKKLNLQHKVKFIGHISGDAKQRLLAGAHFLFMPSHTENFGIVVTEALAQGTPAVASKRTPWKILEDKSAGFWIENDIKSLGRCIDDILALHPKSYQEMCKNTRPLANEYFNIQNNIYKWQEVYETLANHTTKFAKV
ncbi:MAG: glycosyltransferase family 4 protein, partial [Bacteroidota bacterium]